MRAGTCHGCGQAGHYQTTCPTSPRKDPRVARRVGAQVTYASKPRADPVKAAAHRDRQKVVAAVRMLRAAAERLTSCNRWMAAAEITRYAAKLEEKIAARRVAA